MGDISDMHDLERFMRSPVGKSHLEAISQKLKGHAIAEVDFSNEVHFITIRLILDNGETVSVTQPSLEVTALQKTFEEVIEQEYYVDFPERKHSE